MKMAGRDKFIRLLNNAGRCRGANEREVSSRGLLYVWIFLLRGRTQVDESLIVANDAGAPAPWLSDSHSLRERPLFPPRG